MQCFGRKVLAQSRKLKHFVHDHREVHFPPVLPRTSLPYLACLEHLLDRAKQPIGVFEHDAIEFAAFGFFELPAFESLQVQANGSDGGLQFVRDGVEKTILLLISANFAHEKNGVDHQTRDDEAEENDAENQRDDLTPVEDDPANIDHHGQGNQASAQGYEKCDGLC